MTRRLNTGPVKRLSRVVGGFSLDEGYYGPGIHFFIDIYDALTFT